MERPINPSSAPSPLTFYRGGLNVGVFYPGPPVYPQGSEVFGNQFGGSPSTYRTQATDPGQKSYGWVLILSGEDSYITTRTPSEAKNENVFSSYDGYYNRTKLNSSGNIFISSYRKGNYRDWYVPSRDELAFIAKNLPQSFSLDFRFMAMVDKTYISSTYVKNQPDKQNFLFAQSFIQDTYGTTSLVSDTRLMSVRYVRRVPVTII